MSGCFFSETWCRRQNGLFFTETRCFGSSCRYQQVTAIMSGERPTALYNVFIMSQVTADAPTTVITQQTRGQDC